MMFTGTSQQQDTRFSDKEKKLLKQLKFGDCLNRRVDMSKVKLDVIRPWISKKITDLLHMEDDVVVEFVYNQLEEEKYPCPKKMQINMTGFLNGKNARQFMDELWALLLSAQDSSTGIPKEFIDQKKEEILKREQDNDPHRNRVDDSLASAVSREEAVMKQIEKIKESARVKDEVAQKTNSIVLAKADEISEKLNREKLKQLANNTGGDKESVAEVVAIKQDDPAEEELNNDSTNNSNRRIKSRSPDNRIRSRNYRGRSRNQSKSRDKSPNSKSVAKHENNHRTARNRSRSYDKFRKRSRSRDRKSRSKDRRSRSRDRKDVSNRRNESPRGRNRKDRSLSRDKPGRRGRSRSLKNMNRGSKRDANDSKRGREVDRNRSRDRDRRPRDRKVASRSVSPLVGNNVKKKNNKNTSVTPEKKSRSDESESKKKAENRNNHNSKRERSPERTRKRSTSRQRDNSTTLPPSQSTEKLSSSQKSSRNKKSEDGKMPLKSQGENRKTETNGRESRRQQKSIEREEEREPKPVVRKRSPVVQERPRYDVHDSSLSRTPSPFLVASERNPQLMTGTLAERLAVKRKERIKLLDRENSSSENEEPPKQKAKIVPVEPEESTSSKKMKKSKKSKKSSSRKSKKHKKKRSKKDSSDSADEDDEDDEPPPIVDIHTKENRDALEKQLRERALKSMRKHKLSD